MANQQHQQVVVDSKERFDTTIQQYISAGYGPRQMTNELAILFKPGAQNNLGCMFWFWIFVFFPVAIVMAVNNSNKETGELTVTIRLEKSTASVLPGPGAFVPDMPAELQMSPDRDHWWDGGAWVNADHSAPPMATKSADGRLWWDGEEWRAVR